MVRLIDMQDNLSKAPLASRAQQVQQTTPEMAHRQVSQELAQQRLQDQSRPLPAEEADHVELHPDEGEQQQGQEREEKKDRVDDTEEKSISAAGEDEDSSHIDIVA